MDGRTYLYQRQPRLAFDLFAACGEPAMVEPVEF
jgi:hypothetical protein